MVSRALVRRRAEERGATLFVVVLVLTLLTAVGLFAAQSATLVDQASGYSRQASQTSYLAEYGTLLTTSELGSAPAGYVGHMMKGEDKCRANQGIEESGVGSPPCLVLYMRNFEAVMGSEALDTAALPNLTPLFAIEVTDPGPTGAPIAGMDLGGTGTTFGYRKVTVTSTSQMRPGTSTAICDDKTSAVTAQQMMRAHLVVGPIPIEQ